MSTIRLPVAVATAAATALMPAGMMEALAYVAARVSVRLRAC